MQVLLDLAPLDRASITSLLNWLARHNAQLYRSRPSLPGLYLSGVTYRFERPLELWSDAVRMMQRGVEDCDGLAAARAGELLARGWRALQPTDPGYAAAKALGMESIPAEVILEPDPRGADLHALVRYRVAGVDHHDDPSLRLGMEPGRMDANTLALWRKHGVTPRARQAPSWSTT